MSNFIETYDVGNTGKLLKEFFLESRDLAGLTPYEKPFGQKEWQVGSDFRTAEINYLLGRTAEELLPVEATTAIKNLSIGKFPHVIHLIGMPTGEADHGKPEKGFPFCAMMLRAISALLVKRDSEWRNAYFGSRFVFESNSDTRLQEMHCDYVNDDDFLPYDDNGPNSDQTYSVLHYIKTNGVTPTWFTPYNRKDAVKFPDESRHIPIVAHSGDIIMFNNLKVLHARGQVPLTSPDSIPVSPERHYVAINMKGPYAPLRIGPEKSVIQYAGVLLAAVAN